MAHLDHCFQVELVLGILVYVEGGKPEDPEKNPQNKDENNHKLNPYVISRPGVEPKPQLLDKTHSWMFPAASV